MSSSSDDGFSDSHSSESADEEPTKSKRNPTVNLKSLKEKKKTINSRSNSSSGSETNSSDDLEEFSDMELASSRSRPSMRKADYQTMKQIFQKSKSRSRSRSPLDEDPDHEIGEESFSNNKSVDKADESNSADLTQKQRDRDRHIRVSRSELANVGSSESKDFTWVGPIRNARSEVWNHWGFKKYAQKSVDRKIVFCKICGHSVSYKGTNTNMKFHLNSRHPNLSKEVEVTQPKASQYFADSKLVRKQKYAKHHPINKKARAALVKWFCKKDRPFLMTEDPEFREFCEVLDPNYELPCRETIRKDMEGTYAVEKEKFMKKLEKVPFLFGTNDGATAMNSESFVCNTVHFVDPETWKFEFEILGCTMMKERHTAKNYRRHIDNTEEDFGIKGKVFGYTTDNENKMHKAFEDDERNGCIAHIQSKTMEKAVEAVKCISLVRKKLRKVAKLNKFSKFKYALDEAQKSKGLPQRKVLQEVKTRFTSTQTMLQSVMSFDEQKTKEETQNKAKLNIEAVNDALDRVGSKKAQELKLSGSDVEIIVATSCVLGPICDMLTMLGGDKYVTGSIVLPYMKKIVSLTKVEDTDPVFIADFKNFIIKDFLQRCRDNLNFGLLKKATFLDPRFKSMKCIEEPQRAQLKKEIKLELENTIVINEQKPAGPDDSNKEQKKRKRLSLESDDEDEDTGDLGVDKELEKYIDDTKLAEELDPLIDFWKKKEHLYPRLSILAKKYLSVQATSSPSERTVSKLNNVVTKKRNRITPTHTNQTIFLSKRL